MSEIDQVVRVPAGHQVADILRKWIMAGRLPAGQYIRQDAIARDLAISRIPVREALTILEGEGLVKHERYKGTMVVELSVNEVTEIYALRELLEPFLLQKAFSNLSRDDLDRAESIIEESDKCESDDKRARLKWEFHKTLFLPAKMPLMLRTLEHVIRRSDRYFRLQRTMSHAVHGNSKEQHQEIIDHIRAGDHHGAINSLKRHIVASKVDLTDVISNAASPDTFVESKP